MSVQQSLSIMHLISSVGPGSFGVGPVALNLALEQLRLGHKPEIWCLDTNEDKQWASESSGFPVDLIKTFKTLGPTFLRYSPAMEQAIIEEHGQSFDVIHQHGIWTAISRVTNVWRQRTSKPSVIVPHGSLQKWCLKKSALKKKLALMVYDSHNFQAASCFHALADAELQDCRCFGLQNPVAIVANGVSRKWLDTSGDTDRFRRDYDIPADKSLALFVSRITPKKGLPMLFEALAGLQSEISHWLFLIGGVDEFCHQSECERLVESLGLRSHVRFLGPLFGEDKADAFAAANLFVLPSYSEGAPIVVLEALAAGVPVVTTKASPWSDLEKHHCGWWTDISSVSIAHAVKDAVARSRKELSEMGENGRRLVSSNYTWQESAEKTILLYEWLLGNADKPSFVDTLSR